VPTVTQPIDPETAWKQVLGGQQPDPLSLQLLIKEREKKISSRITNRLAELNSIIKDLTTPDQKRRATIEIKKLKLLQLQKKLRFEVAERMRKCAEMESGTDHNVYKYVSYKWVYIH
jgi:hypothetical protein